MGFGNLQTAFEENQIDEVVFNQLDEKDIKELIPILGLRKTFSAKFKVYRQIQNSQTDSESTDPSSISSESSIVIPYGPKRETGTTKGILAKGRLIDKVKNILYQCGETPIKYKSKGKLDNTLSQEEPSTSAGVASEENDQKGITFLKHFTEPWEEILHKRKKTAKLRKKSEKQTVQEFINEWPILKDIRAEQLINLDFELWYGRKIAYVYRRYGIKKKKLW